MTTGAEEVGVDQEGSTARTEAPASDQIAGRELNALIARKLFGAALGHKQPNYSTSIADAWLIVQKLAECNERVEVTAEKRSFRHRCRIWSDGYHCREATAIAAPLAICRAALSEVRGDLV